tara:strand:+ start:104921 stop:106738 length:1818 start_codon:yes stop_codon:yes gene_type:complete
MIRPANWYRYLALLTILLTAACSDGNNNGNAGTEPEVPPPGPTCAELVPQAMQACLGEMNATAAACYADGGSACGTDDPGFVTALSDLTSAVEGACKDGDFMGMSTEATVGRMEYACQSQSDALTWRSFGGPQGAAWPEADESSQACLLSAQQAAAQFFDSSLTALNECLANDDCSNAADARSSALQTAVNDVSAVCEDLPSLVAVSPQTYIERSADQVDCLVATTHEDTNGLALTCGPSYVESLPPRGEWTQIILPEEKWGSRCGDGTDYAIHIRPAPEGEPLDRVLIALQGGGVCIFEEDCRQRLDSGLFNAQDDDPAGIEGGIASNDPDNPFANWTKVYLPYCDQAVFTGGGVVEQFSDFEVNRFGSINLRAGVRASRDIVWSMLDAAGGTGYRPDEIIALFGGFSAGAYGTIYNYHFMLDEILWPRTAAFPDAGGALDNGGIGVRTLGDVKIPQWNVTEYLPSYCFTGECAVGPEIYKAMAPRLRQVPEQQILVLSNQKDLTQQGDAFFSDEAQWINAMREAYCETRNLNGIQWYLTSDSVNSVHVVSIRDDLYYGEVAGERMVDWFARAVEDPDSISDFAEEGDFVTDIPGALPFPCDLP